MNEYTLSVQDFFSRCNWQGYLDSDTTDSNIISANWQCLTVKEFFRQNNWQGQLLNNKLSPQAKNPLTMAVRDFFQTMTWEGIAQIGVVPKLPSSLDLKSPSSGELKLDDLSDLF